MPFDLVLEFECFGDPRDGCSGTLILLGLLVDVFVNTHDVSQLLLGIVNI